MTSKQRVDEWPVLASLRAVAAGVWSALTVLALVASTAAAQTNSSCAVPTARLHSEVLEVHNKQQNVGLAVALRRGQELVFRADVGLSDLEHRVAVDSTTVFGIPSVSKLFTAAALLRLYAEGRVDLDAVVQQYVPEFPRYAAGDVTVRMLATHRSGIPHPQERTPQLFATHYPTAMAALEVFTDDTLVAVPNTRRVYSSSNYNLLAAIIARIQGTAFPNVVTELVLDPLQLNHILIDDVLRPTPGRSERYSFFQPWTYAPGDSLYVVPRWTTASTPAAATSSPPRPT